MNRNEKINAIIQASTKPCPDIVAIRQWLGSDNKWYSVFGVPHGVTLTDTSRIVGYAYSDKHGVTFGTRSKSAEEAKARHEEYEATKATDFRQHLESCSEADLDSKYAYWVELKPRV